MSEFSVRTIVYVIIILLVIVLAIVGISKLGVVDTIKNWMLGSTENNFTDDDNFIPAEIIPLEYPEKIVFWIDGNDREGISFNCQSKGWKWYKKESGWMNVDTAQYSTYFNDGVKIQKNKDLILGLVNSDCKSGLQMIVDRVRKNDEGNKVFAVKLGVLVNGKSHSYPYDDEALKDTRILVKRLNSITG